MHKQVNLGQDVMQSQALQSLQLHDVCEEQLRDGQPFQNMLQGDFNVKLSPQHRQTPLHLELQAGLTLTCPTLNLQ